MTVCSNYTQKDCISPSLHLVTAVLAAGRLVDPGGPVDIILVTGSEVRGFKPGPGRWIFRA